MYPPTKEVLEQTGERPTVDDACAFYQKHAKHQVKCSDCDGIVCQYVDTGLLGYHEGCPTESAYCGSCSLPLREDGFIDENRIQEDN